MNHSLGESLEGYGVVENPSRVISTLRFRWPWRAYQQRVLDALQVHLTDRRLHVVAAPGSGKTCLGLEVFCRLQAPCLILSPTRIIRDQWISRLRDFLPSDTSFPPDWCSDSLDKPGILISITYQALHTRYRSLQEEELEDQQDNWSTDQPPNETELEEVSRVLRIAGIRTVILDEAHHLRKEWWEALSRLVDNLPNVHAVSLTATPPYDVVGPEWRRYEALCGPIDEQISVPELVRSGTLCPHQDYIRAVAVDADVSQQSQRYDRSAQQVCARLLEDDVFLTALRSHPWLSTESPDQEVILDKVELLSALLIYLNTRGLELPSHLLELLDSRPQELPEFDRNWCQTLVRHYLAAANWPLTEELESHRKALRKSLRDAGLLWRNELRLNASRQIRDRIRLSPTKIAACVDVYQLEKAYRGNALRQVILTDFIRDDGKEGIGARPVFEAIHNAMSPLDRTGLALLTGRLSILHRSRLEQLRESLGEESRKLETVELKGFPGFASVSLGGRPGNLVNGFTQLFVSGQLRVLVGTRALLGEGWDAPVINSLVLASFVGSYMLTNQMRGRALRKDGLNPSKISSIWHLVAVESSTPSGWDDYEELQRRFDTFVGLAVSRPSIETGLQRLSLPEKVERRWIEQVNESSAARLQSSAELYDRWQSAIEEAECGQVLPGVDTASQPSLKRTLFRNTLRYLLFSALGAWLTVSLQVAQTIRVDSVRLLLYLLGASGIAGLLYAGPKLLKAGWLYLRCLPVDGSLKQVGNALMHALADADIIETNRYRLSVRCKELVPGEFSLALVGGTYYESNLFADSLDEILGPIENPRYLITRSAGQWPFPRKDFHAVPTVLATHKEKAEAFLSQWRRRLGTAELVYTRNDGGRRLLLQARLRAFSTAFQKKSRRADRWH